MAYCLPVLYYDAEFSFVLEGIEWGGEKLLESYNESF